MLYIKENNLVDLSMDFAVKIIKVCDKIKGHYSINNQLERSGTSIGANIREANYAHVENDFVSKLQIVLKECFETEYWLRLLVKSELLTNEEGESLLKDCLEIKRVLISSINTAKKNNKYNCHLNHLALPEKRLFFGIVFFQWVEGFFQKSILKQKGRGKRF